MLPPRLTAQLRIEVDRWVDDGLRAKSIACCQDPDPAAEPEVTELDLAAHAELVCFPPLMELLFQLMRSEFAFHHLHADRHGPDTAGKAWHHDYEQRPQSNRSHSMIHALHYLDGLDDRTASLVVLPGSHLAVAEKNAKEGHGTAVLPGEVVIDELPAGSTVVLHSALFHARRPGNTRDRRPRYLTDASYCQVGIRWPPVKPYWRSMLRHGRSLGLDRGRWPEMFDERHFVEYVRPA